MSSTRTKADLLARIEDEREQWHRLLARIDRAHMEEPGPMGVWTFKDLTAHLLGWCERTIGRLDAAGRGDETPPPPWPAEWDEADDASVDAINAWIYEQHRERPLDDVLADADVSYQRLASIVSSLSEEDVTSPERFPYLEGQALADADLFGHLHEEHEPAIHAWLAERGR